MLCLSIWIAVKHALSTLRDDKIPRLNLPATAEEILRRITEQNDYSKKDAAGKISLDESEVTLVSLPTTSVGKNKQISQAGASFTPKIADCIDI